MHCSPGIDLPIDIGTKRLGRGERGRGGGGQGGGRYPYQMMLLQAVLSEFGESFLRTVSKRRQLFVSGSHGSMAIQGSLRDRRSCGGGR